MLGFLSNWYWRWRSAMSRPPFSLADDDARALLALLPPIVIRHANDLRNHRLFVRDFIEAVHNATGRTYGPDVYRRLLAAYAPERRPSTTTLAAEKAALEQRLALIPAIVASAQAGEGGEPLADLLRRVVRGVLAESGRDQDDAEAVPQQYRAHADYLRERLDRTEAELANARETAARLAAQLQLAQSQAALYQEQLQLAQAAAAKQAQANEQLPQALQDMRQFALRAMDDVRGETRAVKENNAYLMQQLKDQEATLETFRQIAYRHGAPIPGQRNGGPVR